MPPPLVKGINGSSATRLDALNQMACVAHRKEINPFDNAALIPIQKKCNPLDKHVGLLFHADLLRKLTDFLGLREVPQCPTADLLSRAREARDQR